ncbi:Ig-like domain-containing protein [Streptomyces sp. NPDC050504]|uniref:Ig-like domain-containing protein n=1 Tax=Streptomyces sp. NPDC050504 TaxID=3365618 RepID=UPI0037B31869
MHAPTPLRAPRLLTCLLLLLAAAVAPLAQAPAARADDTLGKLTPAPLTGRIGDNPTFPKVATDGACPTANSHQVVLALRTPNGVSTLGKTAVGGPFNQGPISVDVPTGTSLEQRLRSIVPAGSLDGTYEIRLICRDEMNTGSTYFPAQVKVVGDTWSVQAAQATTTALAASPTGTAKAGAEVTLTASVAPAAAAGRVSFLDGTTEVGAADVAGGRAEVKTKALAKGAHSLTAKFTPADSGAYAGSVSAAVDYTVTDADPGPGPGPGDPDDLDVTDKDGKALGDNPKLTPGQAVLVTARGFAKDGKVKAALDGGTSGAALPDAKADAKGAVEKYAFTVPKKIADGPHALTLTEDKADGHKVEFAFTTGDDAPGPGEPSGDPSPDPSKTGKPGDTAGTDTGGSGDTAGSGSAGAAGGGDGGGSGSGGGDGGAKGPLAATGSSALGLGLAALALTGAGAACVAAARRRGLLAFGTPRH